MNVMTEAGGGPRMSRRRLAFAVVALLLVPGAALATENVTLSDQVVLRLAAVAETPEGLVGSTASATVMVSPDGSGHVFLDTFPLTQVDMQGSARLAARVAARVSGVALEAQDFFFVIRSASEQIGGPSAGATLTVGAIAALNGWEVRPDVMMTGTINPDGSIGPVGGIVEKAQAARNAQMTRFLFPEGQEIVPLRNDPTAGVDVVRYCAEHLKIECIAVGDVRDAVGHMTDHVIERPPLNGNVTGPLFQSKIEPLAAQLVEQAAQRVRDAQGAVAAVPQAEARTALEARLADAESTLGRAREAAANGTHYTASSLSFQAAVAAHRTHNAARFLAQGPPALDDALDRARAAVSDARRAVDRVDVADASLFETTGAAQERLLEAEHGLRDAETLAAQGTTQSSFEAAETAAFVVERAATAVWWLQIGRDLPAGEAITPEQLERAARDTLTASQEVVAYAEAVFNAAQGGGGTLTDAREKLASAQEAMGRGYHPGAMILALQAETRASALLTVAGFNGGAPASVFEQAQETAARAIQEARERGVEPLVAQSMYEFSFAQPGAVDRLAFLGMARVTANLAGLPGLFSDPTAPQSRFQGVPETIGVPHAWVAAAFAVGIALGAGIGLAALMPREDEEEPRGTAVAHADASLDHPR